MGVCSSKVDATEDSASASNGWQHGPAPDAKQAPCVRQQPYQEPQATLDAQQLSDDALGEVLSHLLLQDQARAACASQRLRRLVEGSDKVLRHTDMRQVPRQQLDQALAWLGAHPPAVAAVTSAVLPLNHALSPALLAALTNLHQLQLYEAAPRAAAGTAPAAAAPPPLSALPLCGLSHLRSLVLHLPRGALPKGVALSLHPGLVSLSLSACSFAAVASALPPPDALPALRELGVSALDTNSGSGATSASVRALLTAVACYCGHGGNSGSGTGTAILSAPGPCQLRRLRLGRFCSLPPELSVSLGVGLDELELEVHGRVLKAAQGGLLQPLSATAMGVPHAPSAAHLHLRLSAPVLARCDGLGADWGVHALHNLRTLRLHNLYPSTSGTGDSGCGGGGGFDVSALAALPRLCELHLGFEAVDVVQGCRQRLVLRGLPSLAQLHELSLCSSGRWLDVRMDAPPGLHSLLVVCEGAVALAVPGASLGSAAATSSSSSSSSSTTSATSSARSLSAAKDPQHPGLDDSFTSLASVCVVCSQDTMTRPRLVSIDEHRESFKGSRGRAPAVELNTLAVVAAAIHVLDGELPPDADARVKKLLGRKEAARLQWPHAEVAPCLRLQEWVQVKGVQLAALGLETVEGHAADAALGGGERGAPLLASCTASKGKLQERVLLMQHPLKDSTVAALLEMARS